MTAQEEITALGIEVHDLHITADGATYTGDLTDEQATQVSEIAKRHMAMLASTPTLEEQIEALKLVVSTLMEMQ
jgi:fatty acid-binding protein DegV